MFRDEGYTLFPAVFIFSSYAKCRSHVVHPRHPIRFHLIGFPQNLYRVARHKNSSSGRKKRKMRREGRREEKEERKGGVPLSSAL
jgi:hypothetical protein